MNTNKTNRKLIHINELNIGDVVDFHCKNGVVVENCKLVTISLNTVCFTDCNDSKSEVFVYYIDKINGIYLHVKQKEITQKIFGKNKSHIRGYFVARKTNAGKIAIGYSVCNKKDKFNKKLGLNIARSRAFNYDSTIPNDIPVSIYSDFNKFVNRAQKFFKDATK